MKAGVLGGAGDEFCDVELGEISVDRHMVHRFVNGIVGADGKVGAKGSEFGSGFGEELADRGPVTGLQEAGVLSETESVEHDLRVVEGAEEGSGLGGNGLEAEGGAGTATGSDADGLGLVPGNGHGREGWMGARLGCFQRFDSFFWEC